MFTYLRLLIKKIIDSDSAEGVAAFFGLGTGILFTMMFAQWSTQGKIYRLQDIANTERLKSQFAISDLQQCMGKLNDRSNTTTTR